MYSMIIRRRKSFDKAFQKADKHIAHKTLETLVIFKDNHADRALNNHALQ
jgi:hypothetical protein